MSSTALLERVRREYAHATVHPLRACELCTHHHLLAGALHCGNAHVAGTHRTVPAAQARRHAGGCGPDAMHLHYPAIEPVRSVRISAWGAA